MRSLSLVTASPFRSQSGKIVATVQPFSSSSEDLYRSRSSSTSPQDTPKKNKSWCSTSLQESGVFEGEPIEICHAATQTELIDFPNLVKTNAELCAEIEKLNRFREKVEENQGLALIASDSNDQRRLQYYKDRVSALESKVLIFESSGDLQTKRLADRLQKEIQLENLLRQYKDRILKLQSENRLLEDERNELEEIENDTRLLNQRLEIEMEVMSQRNIELEITKENYHEKYQEAKEMIACLEETIAKYEERIFVLEEHENDLKHQLELISALLPIMGAYCVWRARQRWLSAHSLASPLELPAPDTTSLIPDTSSVVVVVNTTPAEPMEVDDSTSDDNATITYLQQRVNELLNREKELTQNISELNRAYNETLENADNLWAQMEKEYKERIAAYEDSELSLKSKLCQLEERLEKDSFYAQERITHLEDTEINLKDRITKLIKENKEIMAKNATLLEECNHLKEEYAKLRQYVDGPATEAIEKEKRKIKALEEELIMATKMLKNAEDAHLQEMVTLKGQLKTVSKELNHSEVTNGELKEEVETLEGRIRELSRQRTVYEDKIKYLSDELKSKERVVKPSYLMERSLAQELARPVRKSFSSDSSECSRRSTEFLDRLEVGIAQLMPENVIKVLLT